MPGNSKEQLSKDEQYEKLLGIIKNRGFIWGPSPEIYLGGVAGFYDFGPMGKRIKNNIENTIRRVCIRHNFWEVECPLIMPRIVWEASGHLERFTDASITCTNEKCRTNLRADNYIKEKFPEEKVDGLTYAQLDAAITRLNIKCPKCGSTFGPVSSYNLMMKTQIGLDQEAYLRPETATTTYLPFKRYRSVFRDKLPFQVMQIGPAFRNEISPRQGMLRMRQFTQAELQIFITNELATNFEDFDAVKDEKLPMLPAKVQEEDKDTVEEISLEKAMKDGVLQKKAYAYCLYLAKEIFLSMGFPPSSIRFRQHKSNEKAHYALDAWDLEVQSNKFGWVECCGIHDRSTYDLSRHSKYSNEDFSVGSKDAKEIPGVLEIAFGIERPLYLLLESVYKEDIIENEERTWFKFPPNIAPIQIAVFPLVKKDQIPEKATEIYLNLLERGFHSYYDESGSIGRRYRRQDEIGTPFCITVDYDTLKDQAVTIRKRDDTTQSRVPICDIEKWLTNALRQKIV